MLGSCPTKQYIWLATKMVLYLYCFRYMKGRLSCDDVNSFIDTLNCVLKKKYAILNLKRKEVKRKDLIQYSDWKSQEMEHKMIGNN